MSNKIMIHFCSAPYQSNGDQRRTRDLKENNIPYMFLNS